jgi:hypothetical protein
MTMFSGRRIGVFNRWRLMLVAALAAGAMSVAFAGQALASEPGEWNYWTPENVGGQELQTPVNVGEARNGGYLLDVWRGADNSHVWMSVNNGSPFTLGDTATNAAPAVVPYGTNEFMVIHTGTDGNIYWTIVEPAGGTWWGEWYQVPYQSTDAAMAVSATQMGAGSQLVYMVYHSSTDDHLWGTLFNGGSGGSGWQPAQDLGGGQSVWAPSVVYNPTSQLLFAAVRGEDNAVYLSSSAWSGADWSPWTQVAPPGSTEDTPHLAVMSDGLMLADFLDTSNNIWYRAFDPYGNPGAGWSADTTGWQSVWAATLVAVGYAVVAILTGEDGVAYWKQVYGS